MPEKPNKRCWRLRNPRGDRTFRFKNQKFYRRKRSRLVGGLFPYFRLNKHTLELKQNNNDIDVAVNFHLRSRGYKTSATNPQGRAPVISYTLKTGAGDVVTLNDVATLNFEPDTVEDRNAQTVIAGRSVDEFVEACWSVSDYRIVKHGTRGNPPG